MVISFLRSAPACFAAAYRNLKAGSRMAVLDEARCCFGSELSVLAGDEGGRFLDRGEVSNRSLEAEEGESSSFGSETCA